MVQENELLFLGLPLPLKEFPVAAAAVRRDSD